MTLESVPLFRHPVLLRNDETVPLQHAVDRGHDRWAGQTRLHQFRVQGPRTPPRIIDTELHDQRFNL